MVHKVTLEVSFTFFWRKITAITISSLKITIFTYENDISDFFDPYRLSVYPYVYRNCYNNFLGLEYNIVFQCFNFTLLYMSTDGKQNHLTIEKSSVGRNSLPSGCSKTHTSETTQLFFFFLREREEQSQYNYTSLYPVPPHLHHLHKIYQPKCLFRAQTFRFPS